MSLSANDLLRQLSLGNPKFPEEQLHNPDIPTPNSDFDERREIRDRAFSVLRLPSEPRNGGYFRLGRNKPRIDPRQDDFLMDNAIDPNVIRARVNPDDAIPTMLSGETIKYSLVPENIEETNNITLIQKARASFSNYKDRFRLPQAVIEGK